MTVEEVLTIGHLRAGIVVPPPSLTPAHRSPTPCPPSTHAPMRPHFLSLSYTHKAHKTPPSFSAQPNLRPVQCPTLTTCPAWPHPHHSSLVPSVVVAPKPGSNPNPNPNDNPQCHANPSYSPRLASHRMLDAGPFTTTQYHTKHKTQSPTGEVKPVSLSRYAPVQLM